MKIFLVLFLSFVELYPLQVLAQDEKHLDSGSSNRSATPSRTNQDFPSAIEAVLRDFPDNFRHISGELVLAQGEIENYASVIELPGSENCSITRYHSMEDSTASWQARMYQGDQFAEASHTYNQLYGKLKNCTLQLPDGSLIFLKGDWAPAKEESPFTTSVLRLLTADPRYKDLKVEIELVYLISNWVININILSKKPDDQPGG